MDQRIRMTGKTMHILSYFVENVSREVSGAEIYKNLGFSTGTTYPILRRLEDAGWLSSRREIIDPKIEGRPPYRFYTMNAEVACVANARLAEKGFYDTSASGGVHALA